MISYSILMEQIGRTPQCTLNLHESRLSVDPSINEANQAVSYSSLDSLGDRYYYRLDDNTRVMVTRSTQMKINTIAEQYPILIDYMNEGLEAFKSIVRIIK